jgi:hypothetical protein
MPVEDASGWIDEPDFAAVVWRDRARSFSEVSALHHPLKESAFIRDDPRPVAA